MQAPWSAGVWLRTSVERQRAALLARIDPSTMSEERKGLMRAIDERLREFGQDFEQTSVPASAVGEECKRELESLEGGADGGGGEGDPASDPPIRGGIQLDFGRLLSKPFHELIKNSVCEIKPLKAPATRPHATRQGQRHCSFARLSGVHRVARRTSGVLYQESSSPLSCKTD